jgi:hypothetical protein
LDGTGGEILRGYAAHDDIRNETLKLQQYTSPS